MAYSPMPIADMNAEAAALLPMPALRKYCGDALPRRWARRPETAPGIFRHSFGKKATAATSTSRGHDDGNRKYFADEPAGAERQPFRHEEVIATRIIARRGDMPVIKISCRARSSGMTEIQR